LLFLKTLLYEPGMEHGFTKVFDEEAIAAIRSNRPSEN
jgi:hypothetical protein